MAEEAITQCGMTAHRVGRLWKFKFLKAEEWIGSGQAAGDIESE